MKRRPYLSLSIALTLVAMCGCRSPYHADQDAFTGGLIGSGIGAVIGNQAGNTAEGAIVGGAAGALLGNVVGEQKDYIEAQNRALIEAQLGQAVRAGVVTHDEVIAMAQAGVADNLIINHIRHHGITSRPDANDLIRLSNSGVSPSVVQAMQQPPPVAAVPAGPAAQPVIVEEHYYGPGFYPRRPWHHPRRYRHGPRWNVGVAFGG